MNTFIAFDFETATMTPESACSLAVSVFVDGELSETYARLFRPPENRFDDDTIRIHQIRPADVANEPSFADVWPDFAPYFENSFAFAHNAEFDLGVLRASLGYYGVALPHFTCGCSLLLARRVWRDLPSYALNNVGRFLGYEFHHHRADEDATMCGRIVLAAMRETKQDDPAALLAAMGLAPVEFPGDTWEQGGLF